MWKYYLCMFTALDQTLVICYCQLCLSVSSFARYASDEKWITKCAKEVVKNTILFIEWQV